MYTVFSLWSLHCLSVSLGLHPLRLFSIFLFVFSCFYPFEGNDEGWVADLLGADSVGIFTTTFFCFTFCYYSCFPSPRLVALPRLKNLVCPTILPIAGGRIIGFIPFPGVFVQCEMQSVLSRIWTRVAVSSSYDDNHYTSPMARETWVQSQVESYQRLKKWYLMPPCLTLSIIRYGSRVK